MKKLKNILLVDDDEITNFINKDIIEQMGITEHIQVCENGKEAIDYLSAIYSPDPPEGHYPPDIIFLDINMPIMNGFQFLKEYHEQFDSDKSCKLIFMLTTSLRNQDIDGALELRAIVSDYLEKPLDAEKVGTIIKQYFDFHYQAQ
ncbi:MAG: response regulator [Bacteroidota bacterium]|nr:response regulator [Bacteroidota bacterium]